MSPVVLVDSVVVIGAAIDSDQNHDAASDIVHGIDEGELPPAIIHDYVYAEIVNFLTKTTGVAQSEIFDLINRIDVAENFRLYRAPDAYFESGRNEIYFRYDALSLTDAISVSFMENSGIDYLYSFDSGFDAVDEVTRLDTADSPY